MRARAGSAAAFVLVLSASLGMKALAVYRDAHHEPLNAESRYAAFIVAHGYAPAGENHLMAGGEDFRAQLFVDPRCERPLAMMPIPISGAGASLISGLVQEGDRLFFVYEGRIHDVPPVASSYVWAKLGSVLYRLGLAARRPMTTIIAVVQPGECRDAAALPWQEA